MIEDYLAEQRAQAKKRLHEQLARIAGPTHQTGVEIHVVEGSADEEILKAVDKLKIDMVIMGTAARTGLARMMLGNTAERLISHFRCSLIAVKPPGFCSPFAAASEDEESFARVQKWKRNPFLRRQNSEPFRQETRASLRQARRVATGHNVSCSRLGGLICG